ncbi:demethylmenaquinone methyltransferase [Alkalicoccus urumqiensis]|uniref:Demethylmenaquinone methyltransferase n=1 Tax=Alkalicoccus urumqiensis TaxID=1548213 RepID=A0A2P6MKJ5_ALKUR|nr:demethylmenaquinone methyltransferase [Alkalicoccus urumqiensis]PRO66807.1 bifunctional demethylmenaquinone methyltransferase/2-methoxy-6-polyprenyl-1,4-benzoquinol methylase [Alkalicoccus urumqiensis]
MEHPKEKRVHDVFETISGRYDRMNSIISFQQHKRWRKKTMKQMNVQPGDRCLDVCCGTADWTLALSDAAGPDGDVTGLDFSENMLQVGRVKTNDRPDINLIQGNAMALPFEDNTYDVVTIGFGLRNVPDYMQVLAEMHRVVKPGGQVVCLETSQPEMPVVSGLYWFYFSILMPQLGRLFAGSYEQYSWLQESSREFPGREELRAMFFDAGFHTVRVKAFALGAAAAHFGRKDDQHDS